jgi:uncharacterized protein (TIGR03435 family)
MSRYLAIGLILAASPAIAQLKVGQPAPEIRLDQLIPEQPVIHARLDALKGKVIALEFWATSCSLCIAAQPHWNELAMRFREKPIVFLSVTDEDRPKVEAFLDKHPIEGWVGIAKVAGLKKDYGVEGLPRTFLIDAQGKLAADIYPWQLNPTVVEDLLAGRTPSIPKGLDMKSISKRDDPSTPAPVLDAIVRPAGDPTIRGGMATTNESLSARNGTLRRYLTSAYQVPSSRIVGEPIQDMGLYDLSIRVPGATRESIRTLLGDVLCAAFHIHAVKEKREMDALVLSAPKGKPDMLVAATPPANMGGAVLGATGGGISHGKIRLTNGDTLMLALSLESEFGKPVIDETGITGRYNLNLSYDEAAPGGLETAIRKMGFELTPARRTVEVLVVTKTN